MAVIIYCTLSSKREMITFGYTMLLGLAFVLYAPSTYWDEIETIKETRDGTAETGRKYWEAAFRMYLDHPTIGVEAGNGGIPPWAMKLRLTSKTTKTILTMCPKNRRKIIIWPF